MAYASRTGTRRNLDALRAHGWRLMVSARGVHRTEGFPYSIDNGAWTAFQRQEPFAIDPFVRVVEELGRGSDFIVVPDRVMDAAETLRMAEHWLPRLARYPLLIAVQNGMGGGDVAPWLGPRCGIFLGGDDPWKVATAAAWGRLARERRCLFHWGRVNTSRRIAQAQAAGCTSFDGSGPSRFSVETPRLDAARRRSVQMGWL